MKGNWIGPTYRFDGTACQLFFLRMNNTNIQRLWPELNPLWLVTLPMNTSPYTAHQARLSDAGYNVSTDRGSPVRPVTPPIIIGSVEWMYSVAGPSVLTRNVQKVTEAGTFGPAASRMAVLLQDPRQKLPQTARSDTLLPEVSDQPDSGKLPAAQLVTSNETPEISTQPSLPVHAMEAAATYVATPLSCDEFQSAGLVNPTALPAEYDEPKYPLHQVLKNNQSERVKFLIPTGKINVDAPEEVSRNHAILKLMDCCEDGETELSYTCMASEGPA